NNYIQKYKMGTTYEHVGRVENYAGNPSCHAHPFFIRESGNTCSLIANTTTRLDSPPCRWLVKFTPSESQDTCLGTLPIGAPPIPIPVEGFDIVQDEVSGWLYLGSWGEYAVREMPEDGSGSTKIYDKGYGGHTRLAMSYGHSQGGNPDPGNSYNYIELSVRPKSSGGYTFNAGEEIVLDWHVYENLYNLAGVPCNVYLGAAMYPPGWDRAVTVDQLMTSTTIYLFNSNMQPVLLNPASPRPTFSRVVFPLPGGPSGSVSFRAPGGNAGWGVFFAAFVRLDNGAFPYVRPVELSNTFGFP
ncbi:MAG: hypothetical protein NT045_06310, partial [Candidatus Aureabacteria bacterium]|nr:hypothetical protein [Candidatus Auribacterota bacterium]